MKKISLVIPVFNESKNIKLLYDRLLSVFNKLQYDFEIIFIDDGSSDNSAEVISELCSDSRVKGLFLVRNFGHQQALSAGIDFAVADAIITMDCDLQDPPEVIPEMIEKWEQGSEVVYAKRKNFRNDNFIKKLLSVIYYKLIARAQDVDIPRNVGDFRLIDKKVHNELINMTERSRYLRGMVAWLGFKCAYVNYDRPDREFGKSGYSFNKLFKLGMDGLLNFSLLPFKLGLLIGIISIFTGAGIMIFMIIDILVNNVYYHLYKFLVDIIFIFMGFLFILIWIIGEYIGRLIKETKGRPVYVVGKKINL
jgi:dolichol-phosphate mannosyltransferase